MGFPLKLVPVFCFLFYGALIQIYGEEIPTDVQLYITIVVLLINLWVFRIMILRGEIRKEKFRMLLFFLSLSIVLMLYHLWIS